MRFFKNKIISLPLIYLIIFSVIATPIYSQIEANKVRVVMLSSKNSANSYQLEIEKQMRTILQFENSIELVTESELEKLNFSFEVDSIIKNPSKKIFFEVCEKTSSEHLYYSMVQNISSDPSKIVLAGNITRFDKSTLSLYPLKVLSYSSDFHEQLRIAREQLVLTILPEKRETWNAWPVWFIGGLTLFAVLFIFFGKTNTSAEGNQPPPIDPN